MRRPLIKARGWVADLADVLKRSDTTAVQLVTLHRERIFAVARQLYVRGALSGAEVWALCGRYSQLDSDRNGRELF